MRSFEFLVRMRKSFTLPSVIHAKYFDDYFHKGEECKNEDKDNYDIYGDFSQCIRAKYLLFRLHIFYLSHHDSSLKLVLI